MAGQKNTASAGYGKHCMCLWIHSLERDVGATFSLGLRQASSASILCQISFEQQVNFVSPTTFFF